MEWLSIFAASGIGSAIGIGALGWISKEWVGARISKSIQHDYNQKLETLKAELLAENQRRGEEQRRELHIRDRAAAIADLIAEWYSWPDSQTRLNALTVDAFLWMPADILTDLSEVLSHNPNAPDVRVVLSKVRTHLLGTADLDSKLFILFTSEALKRSHEHNSKWIAYPRGQKAGTKADDPER